jgi:hypothetical protein
MPHFSTTAKAFESSGPDSKLEASIKQEMTFLFHNFDGYIVSNCYYPYSFGNAIVIVEAKNILLRVVRDRGDIRLDIAPHHHPDDWHDLSLVISALNTPDEIRRMAFYDLSEAAKVLKPNINHLQEAFSDNQYPRLQVHLLEIDKYEDAITRQWETEINRRLYPDR